jgi:protein-S-isoprenylcysteine O-methyltransferase Ste14
MPLVFDLLVTLVGLSILVLHTWATRRHFTSERLNPGAVLIVLAVDGTAIIYSWMIWVWDQPVWAQAAAICIELAGAWLFLATIRASREAKLRFAFDAASPSGLLTSGPYKRIRHPFYASYLMVWVGWALATWSLWALLPFAALCAIYGIAALREERLFRESALASQYADYRARAGLFWPRPRHRRQRTNGPRG